MLTHLSLRRSLPLLLGLFALLFSLLLLSIELPRRSSAELHNWRQNSAQSLALLQSSLADHLRQGRGEELQTELADLGSLANVRWAMVIDDQQRTIAATRLGLEPTALTGLSRTDLSRLSAGTKAHWLAQGDERFLALYPLDRQGSHMLLVSFDFTEQMQLTRHNTWLFIGEVLLLLFILGLALNLLYNQLVTRRLAAIEQATQRFAQGDQAAHAEISGSDEISQLAGSFNLMFEQLQRQQHSLRESQKLLSTLIDTAPIGMMVVDHELRVEQANPAAARLFSCTPQELQGNLPQDRLLEGGCWERLIQAPASSNLEFTTLRNGHETSLEISMTPFQREGEQHYLVLLRDISDRKLAEQRLRFLAHFDPLTQLANRHQLQQRLEQLLAAGSRLALLFLDIDHFKRINDIHGHELGDRLLVEIAERLKTVMPPHCLLGRSGGDEFVCLLEGAERGNATELGEALLAAFKAPFQVRQYHFSITPSIGLTLHGGQTGSASELLKQADLALYAAKDAGRNNMAMYSPRLSEATERRQMLEAELRLALQRDEFELFYQPQVDCNGQPKAMEALLRWHSPTRGLVAPNEFIPILEDSGLILETTPKIVRMACRQVRQWRLAGLDWRVAINLSPLDFSQDDLAGRLLAISPKKRSAPTGWSWKSPKAPCSATDRRCVTAWHALKSPACRCCWTTSVPATPR